MYPELYVVSVEGEHYVSGTIYTPDGIEQYNGVFNDFNDIFKIKPTFATHIKCYYDDYCIEKNGELFYYLTYSNLDDLKRMLTFMVGDSSTYLIFVPINIIKELGINPNDIEITFSNVSIPQRDQLFCRILGGIPTYIKVVNNKVYVNDVDINFYVDEPAQLKQFMSDIFGIYVTKYYKGLLTWSTILKMWCGIKIL